jgi:hypothetical protein
MEGVRAFGIVTWVSDDKCGILFDEPLSAGQITLLRSKVAIYHGLPLETKAALEDWVTGLAR